jgi:His/Glu/Gln/Arg/opine family amino acid ABC transporter permease subunit
MNRNRRKLFLAVLVLVALMVGGCKGSDYNWGWYEVSPSTEKGASNLKFLFSGIWLTVALSSISIFISVIVGFLLSLPGLSGNYYVRSFNRIYVEIFRSIPLLVLILWVYYGLPVVLGISLNPFTAGIVALALSDSAFEAEIFRAGIQSIERGQTEAADALGFNYAQKMRHIILPQAIRRILPPLGNQFVYMLKMSSLLSIIGLQELTRKANELTVTVYRPLEIYTVLVLEYLLLILIVSWIVRRLEVRLGANAQAAHR